MKKMISLLAVALFATTFAAGCGKFNECNQAKVEADCNKDKFEKDKFENKCHWVKDKTDATKGTCEKISGPDLTADTAKCAAVKALTDDTACKAVGLDNKATHECKFTKPVAPATDGTCAIAAK